MPWQKIPQPKLPLFLLRQGFLLLVCFGLIVSSWFLGVPRATPDGLILASAFADFFIAAAYLSATASFLYFINKSAKNTPFNWVIASFTLFMFFSGLDQCADCVRRVHYYYHHTIYPHSWVLTDIKFICAAAAVVLTIALPQTIPQLIDYVYAGIEQFRTSEAQRIRAQEALLAQEKLATIGKLSAVIAHETNNPLDALGNSIYLLGQLSKASGDVALAEHVEIAKSELERVIEVMQRTLRFQRESKVPVDCDMTKIMDDVVSIQRGKLKRKGIQITKRYEPIPIIHAFPGEMRQVFSNLVSNAIDASPETGGEIKILVKSASDPHDFLIKGVRVYVFDNGGGIPDEMTSRMFSPFATSKGADGSGIGLWVSNEIIKKHCGTIRYRTKAGAGTIFSVFIPIGMEEERPVVRHESVCA